MECNNSDDAWAKLLLQKFHASARIRSPNVIRAHGFEDRLVGIAQKRSGLCITSTRQAFAEAARKDRVLNFVLAMFAIKLQGTSKFALGQLKFSGGHVNLCTQLIETRQIRFSGRPSYGCDLRPGSLKLPFRFRIIAAKPVCQRQPFTNIDGKDGIASALEWADEI
jgi:hypothetical protein